MNCVKDDLYLLDLLDEYGETFYKLIKQVPKGIREDYVHDLRVSARRLMALLQLLVPKTLENPALDSLFALNRVLKLFGNLRDLDVQIDYTFHLLAHHPELKDFYAALVMQQHLAARHVERRLKAIKLDSLQKMNQKIKKRLLNLFKDPATREQIIADLRQDIDHALISVLIASDKIDPTDAETIHRMRLAFKKYRYSVEVIKPFLSITDQELQSLHAYQTMLGEIQDLEVLINSLKRYMLQKKNADHKLMPVKQILEDRKSIHIQKLTRIKPDKLLTR